MRLSELIAALYQLHKERGDGFIVLRDKKNETDDSYATYDIPCIGKVIRNKAKINIDIDDYYYIEIGKRMTE